MSKNTAHLRETHGLERAPLYEERIVTAIRRIIRSVDIYSQRLALESGVTVPQLSCLIRVAESGPMTLKALAESVDLSASTAVGIVDRLEKSAGHPPEVTR